jgi:anaerobic magnesium-protoporphyrin IX monomethyl ester cyclase
MKSILVQPPGNGLFKVPPLGLGYIAAVLKQRGFNVEVLDLNVEPSALDDFLSVERLSIVGVSCGIGNARQAFEVARKVKSCFRGCFLVLGGPYPSLMMEKLLIRHTDVDAVVVGEGEATIVDLFERFQNGETLSGIEGLIFRDGSQIRINPHRKPIEFLDGLPFPAREKLPMQLYGENAGVIFTSRGCPYKCVFCSRAVFGRRWRGHISEYVLSEIEHMRKQYAIGCVSFLDDNFTFNSERVEKILDGIIARKWNLRLYFWNGIRVDSVTQGLLQKMKKSGCIAINYGVESVDADVLAKIRKDVNLDQVKKTVKLTREAGIKANVFLMVGNPGDTSQIIEKIKDFVEQVKVDGVHVSMATPIPRTEFWSWVEKNGRWLGYDQELLDWPIDDDADAYPVFETSDFTAEERTRAYQKIRKILSDKNILV